MSKCTKIRLTAGLRPNPLGELMLDPDPLAAMGLLLQGGMVTGPTSKRTEGRKGGERTVEREGDNPRKSK